MKHIKLYKIFESSDFTSEVHDILADLIDDGFILDITTENSRIDIFKGYDNDGGYIDFDLSILINPIRELLSHLEDRYKLIQFRIYNYLHELIDSSMIAGPFCSQKNIYYDLLNSKRGLNLKKLGSGISPAYISLYFKTKRMD